MIQKKMNSKGNVSGLVAVTVIILLVAPVILFGQNTESVGVYGALDARVSTVRNTTAILAGGRGGWIFDRSFGVGIGGYMLTNHVRAGVQDTSGNSWMTLSYGGLDLEYASSYNDAISVTYQALVGAGSISHDEIPYLDRRQYHDPFFVFEPGIGIELAVSRIFSLGLSVNYRFVGFLSSPLATNSELGGPEANLGLKVGIF
jgi:hypothetical protein